MKLVTFTYTKPNGDVSERELIPTVMPVESNSYEGMDVTSLSVGDFQQYTVELLKLEEEFVRMRKELDAKFDLTHNYRKFLVERMSNITQTKV